MVLTSYLFEFEVLQAPLCSWKILQPLSQDNLERLKEYFTVDALDFPLLTLNDPEKGMIQIK